MCVRVLKYCDQNRLHGESDPTAQTRQKLRDNPEIHTGEIDLWLWEGSVISQTVSHNISSNGVSSISNPTTFVSCDPIII